MIGPATRDEATEPVVGTPFPRQARLTKATDFARVFKNPVVSSDRCFRVLAVPRSEGPSRLGMAVSRKVDRRAVARNRLKRIIRESFRARFSFPETPPLDIVVLPRPGSATICNRRLYDALERHWSRLLAGLRNETHG